MSIDTEDGKGERFKGESMQGKKEKKTVNLLVPSWEEEDGTQNLALLFHLCFINKSKAQGIK